MSAYAALLSLAQTSDMDQNHAKYLFSSNAKEKIRSIHEYVVLLLSFLEDFPEKASRWEGKIRDVAYETDDIINLFLWQKMQLSYVRMNPSSMELEDLLKDVAEKLGTITGATMEDRPAAFSSSSTPAPSSSSSSSSRVANSSSNAVIGLNKDLMAIKERLCGQSSKLQVIPIVGMGGIGKTTLARTIYEDQLIIERFDVRAWVVVSQDYTPHRFRKILLGLLDSMKLLEERLSGEKIEESVIASKVYKSLKGRRYLVVMDDIWGKEVWDDVRNIFPDDSNCSRIMLTSRVLDVAAYPDSHSPLHQMQFMNYSESWNLLKQKVFANNNCPPTLEYVGREIARKCLGLPLVVVLVAGFLSAVEKSVASWEEIAKMVNTFVGQELEKILSLSYSHLPHHLRPCFLFIGGFPEDAKIRASTLIKLWVAEGFLKHKIGCSKSLEEEAEEYLEDLVKRSLVIVNSRKSNGKVNRCGLHDMVRDLCIRKACEEKFLHVFPQDFINEPRRLSLNHSRLSLNLSHADQIWGLNIHTILGFQIHYFPSWPASLGYFRLLRVLDVRDIIHEELPSQVFELFHLRYLAFTSSFKIPSAISNLVYLQTLIFCPFFRYSRAYEKISHFCLPLEIWKMSQLRHLVFYDFYMLPHPPSESNLLLENLQTLSHVENLVWNLKIAYMIPNVKRLKLDYTINQEYNLYDLKHLPHLEELRVNGYLDFSWRSQSPAFPRSLKKLILVGGGFPWDAMSIVGLLPNLKVLKLLDNACDGSTWITVDEEFPQLELLLIDKSSLGEWVTGSSHFPRLKSLVLHSCRRLRQIPQDIGEISTLELIEIDDDDDHLKESAMRIKEVQESYGNDALQIRIIDT